MDNPFEHIHQRLDTIESLCNRLIAKNQLVAENQTISKRPITIEEVAKLTHCQVSTVRGWVNKRLIKSHRQGKRLLFFEDEVIGFVKNGGRLTNDEITATADKAANQGFSHRKGGRCGN